ncbi:uncharacterized protein H6S33_010986 [Morchella sextelata]|uniref:uncharacterized protein n=1 Tax=Morchella sextelata TaxID=1174677 RepID=UPI001D05842A|nr:uncharacterized protein H6S33_010986 [Morchella sextelata]KAH0611721.1 hypothetical protein H6S33_010986 [Morchella sextelata]
MASKTELVELRRRMNRSMSRVLNLLRSKDIPNATMPTQSFEPRIGAPVKDPLAIGNKDPVPGPKKPPPPPPNTPTGDSNKAALEPFDEAEAVLSRKLQEVSDMEVLGRSGASSPTLPTFLDSPSDSLRGSPPPTPPPSPPPSPPRNRWEVEALAEALPQLEEILSGPDLEEIESVRVVVTRPLAGWLLVPRPPPTPYQPCGYDGEIMVSYGVFVIRWGYVDLWFLGESAGEPVEKEYRFGRARRDF